jgi:hypothetical protein
MLYAIGPEVAPSELVELTTTVGAGDRLAVETREGSDGLAMPIGFYDRTLGRSVAR